MLTRARSSGSKCPSPPKPPYKDCPMRETDRQKERERERDSEVCVARSLFAPPPHKIGVITLGTDLRVWTGHGFHCVL